MAQYSILTLNAAFLPRTPVSPNLPDYSYRADKISEIIMRDEIDVVVLNEVFVPEIRARIIQNIENSYRIPGGLDTRDLLRENEFFFSTRDSLSVNRVLPTMPSVKSLAHQQIVRLGQDICGTSRSRRRASLDTWRDVPFIDSGLFFAYRENRGIICSDPPNFVPWVRRGPESISAHMGFFHIKIGFRNAATPASVDLFGLHMNPYQHHRDIREIQLEQLSSFIRHQDDGVFAPLPCCMSRHSECFCPSTRALTARRFISE